MNKISLFSLICLLLSSTMLHAQDETIFTITNDTSTTISIVIQRENKSDYDKAMELKAKATSVSIVFNQKSGDKEQNPKTLYVFEGTTEKNNLGLSDIPEGSFPSSNVKQEITLPSQKANYILEKEGNTYILWGAYNPDSPNTYHKVDEGYFTDETLTISRPEKK